MASISVINEDHPNPGATPHLNPKCKHCIHFSTVPAFRSGGAPATCGSTQINRDPNSHPCIIFKYDTSAFLNLPDDTKERIFDLVEEVEEELGKDGYFVLIGALIEAQGLSRKKLMLGASYKFTTANEKRTGKLLALDRHTVLLLSKGAKYRVPIDQIELVPNKERRKRLASIIR